MKNKKGFTLIELLAVIVILAIIALIAVPVIMNILDKANKSAFKDSAYGLISAGELYFAEQELELNGMEDDKVFTLPSDELNIKGNVPEGTILVVNTNGDIALKMSNGRYCVTKGYDDVDITVTENVEDCQLPKKPNPYIINATNECATVGKCTKEKINSGVKVTVQVNASQTYDFYVISDDGETLTLIMDRNLGNKVAWVNKMDYNDDTNYGSFGNVNKGPITALKHLISQTETWTNIPAIESDEYNNVYIEENGTTRTVGYQKLIITDGAGVLTSQDGSTTNLKGTMRARMLTHGEARSLGCKDDIPNSCQSWLYENLSSANTTAAPEGYWLLTARGYDSGSVMRHTGANKLSNYVMRDEYNGVRPVIKLSKKVSLLLK